MRHARSEFAQDDFVIAQVGGEDKLDRFFLPFFRDGPSGVGRREQDHEDVLRDQKGVEEVLGEAGDLAIQRRAAVAGRPGVEVEHPENGQEDEQVGAADEVRADAAAGADEVVPEHGAEQLQPAAPEQYGRDEQQHGPRQDQLPQVQGAGVGDEDAGDGGHADEAQPFHPGPRGVRPGEEPLQPGEGGGDWGRHECGRP